MYACLFSDFAYAQGCLQTVEIPVGVLDASGKATFCSLNSIWPIRHLFYPLSSSLHLGTNGDSNTFYCTQVVPHFQQPTTKYGPPPQVRIFAFNSNSAAHMHKSNKHGRSIASLVFSIQSKSLSVHK